MIAVGGFGLVVVEIQSMKDTMRASGASMPVLDAQLGQLADQLQHLGGDVRALRTSMGSLDRRVSGAEQAVGEESAKIADQVKGIRLEIDERIEDLALRVEATSSVTSDIRANVRGEISGLRSRVDALAAAMDATDEGS